jgi:hypothetical protein
MPEWLLDAAERSMSQEITTTRQLARGLQSDPKVQVVAEVLTGESAPDLERLFTDLVGGEAVPYAAALRYTDTGLEKRREWERTWDLQRREDAGEKVEIPVPPKYTNKDFRSQVYWRHRGKLDVHKERFIAYPGGEGEEDTSPLVGWAGWDHAQQAKALGALYWERKSEGGWDQERLIPLLAGLLELVPWLRQWHNDPDPEMGGQGLGDYFAGFVEGECLELGLTQDQVRGWTPTPTVGRRKKG